MPKGDVHKKKEIVQDVTLHDLDMSNAKPQVTCCLVPSRTFTCTRSRHVRGRWGRGCYVTYGQAGSQPLTPRRSAAREQ